MKALVIDDSRAIRRILVKTLKELDIEVVEAGHGQEALDKLAAGEEVDLIMVDWNMPEMNGYDFIVAVRAQDKYSEIPIMMVTTESEMSQMTRAIEAGATEYLMKPFTKEMIAEKLDLMGISF
ncbi:MAG: response regulator [Myxococcota bacterium]|nr:response regulator [Myxococcota bacterium]